ncbi:MAG: hypothetical protein II909_03780 [Kiritimatiellae bacterium]|nr:hypothetical protein [Kiritimatiellia bacterium]
MSVHLIVGEDDYLVERAARAAIGDLPVDEIDSATSVNAALQLSDISRVRSEAFAESLFDPARAVWWRNIGFLPGGDRGGKGEDGGKTSEDVKLALENLAKAIAANPPGESVKLVISAPRLLKTSIFAKTLQGVADVKFFETAKGWEAAKNAAVFASDCAAEMGLRFDYGAVDLFCAKVGVSSRSIMSEVCKLRDYLGPGRTTIAKDDIAAITSAGPGTEPEMWAVADAVMRRNADEALAAAMNFKDDSGFPVPVLTTVERTLRQMLDFDLIKDSLSPWQARKMEEALKKWRRSELRSARFRFLNLRERAVSGSADAGEMLFVEIVGACKGKGLGR